MTDHDLDAIFGTAPAKPAAAPIRNTANATPEQKKVVEIIESQSPASAASNLTTGEGGDRDLGAIFGAGTTQDGSTIAPPAPATKPWYESGTVPPPVLSPNSLLPPAAAMVGSNAITNATPNTEPTSPQYHAHKTALQEEQESKAMYEQAKQREHEEAVKAHQARAAELKARHDALEEEHRRNQANYNRALSEHNFAKTMTPEMMYNQYKRDQDAQTPKLGQPAPEVTVNKAPLGGTGTAKYAQEFGATPEEAQRIASMSATQKENIPRQQAALEAVNKMFPNMPVSKYENYPFLLAGESGEEYLKEKRTPEHKAKLAQEQALAEEERIKGMLAERLAEHKAQALTEHERHKEAKEESAARLREARKQLEAHKPPEPPKMSPAEVRANIEQEKKIGKLEKAMEGMRTRQAPRLGVAGADENANTYPMGGGDYGYANELLKGMVNPVTSAQSKALFEHELDKLSARNPTGYAGNLNLARKLMLQKADKNIDENTRLFVDRELANIQRKNPEVIKTLGRIYLP
jgi:hypothetical protein